MFALILDAIDRFAEEIELLKVEQEDELENELPINQDQLTIHCGVIND